MKINNSTLKKLIKEEIQSVIKEMEDSESQLKTESSSARSDFEMIKKVIDIEGLINYLKSSVSSFLSEAAFQDFIKKGKKHSDYMIEKEKAENIYDKHKLSLGEYIIGTPEASNVIAQFGYGRILAALYAGLNMGGGFGFGMMSVGAAIGSSFVVLLAFLVMSLIRDGEDLVRDYGKEIKKIRSGEYYDDSENY
tara:strand:- start:101 stop:682 length:582 start_codon:yes stop_codon:yes gene_type:complete